GTLSFVITSCGGICSVIVRRSTRTIRSTIGIRTKSPGPFGFGIRRPRRKTTPRSYSRATFSALTRNSTRRRATMTRTMTAAVTGRSYPATSPQLDAVHVERQPVQAVDPDALSRSERLARVGAPELAVDEHEAALAHDALHADDLLGADADRHPPRGDRLADRKRPEAAAHGGERSH